MSVELVQFLRNRLADDERQAKAAMTYAAKDWFIETSGIVTTGPEGDVYTDDREVAEHIARHDPARVLREVAAKRELLADYERFVAERRRMMNGWDSYPETSPVLAAFAAVYADHPDFRDEWRPTP